MLVRATSFDSVALTAFSLKNLRTLFSRHLRTRGAVRRLLIEHALCLSIYRADASRHTHLRKLTCAAAARLVFRSAVTVTVPLAVSMAYVTTSQAERAATAELATNRRPLRNVQRPYCGRCARQCAPLIRCGTGRIPCDSVSSKNRSGADVSVFEL